MKFYSYLLTILLMLFLAYSSSFADVSLYQFTQESGTYTSFDDGDMLEDSDDELAGDDKYWEEVEIGFDFEFNGETFDYCCINSNGFIQLGDYTSTYAYVTWPFTDSDFSNTLCVFNNDLQPQADGSSSIQVKVIGSEPNRVFVVQWTDYRIYGVSDEDFDFQVRLNENGSVIEYVYGEMNFAGYQYDTQVGIKGDDNDDYHNRYAYDGENTWETSEQGTDPSDYLDIDTDFYPEEGLTYSFYLPAMEYSSSEAFQNTNNATSGITDTWVIGVVVSAEGISNPISITGMDFSTNGSTNPADISNAKLFFTGTSSAFSTDEQYGSTIIDPSGNFIFSDDFELVEGDNYFWLTYSISEDATTGNVVDAECTNIEVYSPTDDATSFYTPSPSAPSGNRTIVGPMSGIYYVGTGGDFSTFSEAFDAVDQNGVSGDLTFYIISDIIEFETAELIQWTEVGEGGYSVTIMPDGNDDYTISGNHGGNIFFFNGVSNVTFNGSSSVDGNTREVTVNNISTTAVTNLIGFRGSNIVFENLNTHGYAKGNGAGILLESVSEGRIENCHIYRGFSGLAFANECEDLVITKNYIGGDAETDELEQFGVTTVLSTGFEYTCDGLEFTENTVRGVRDNDDAGSVRGLNLTNVLNANISRNKIFDMDNDRGCYAVFLYSTDPALELNINFYNNFIYDIESGPSNFPSGIVFYQANTVNLYHNTIALQGSKTCNSISAPLFMQGLLTDIDFRNNIVVNTFTGASGGNYICYANATGVTFDDAIKNMDYNAYYLSGTTTTFLYYVDGSGSGSFSTLADWKNATDWDENSTASEPSFVSADDYHINGITITDPKFQGDPEILDYVTNDIDYVEGSNEVSDVRSEDNNPMGADCASPILGLQYDINSYEDTFCQGDEVDFSFTPAITGWIDGISRSITPVYKNKWYENGEEINPEDSDFTFNGNSMTVHSVPEGSISYYAEYHFLGQAGQTSESTIYVEAPIVIMSQPEGAEACVGDESIVLSIDAKGTVDSYQWQRLEDGTWIDMDGETNREMFIDLSQGAEGAYYRAKVYGPGNCGAAELTSESVQVVVRYPLGSPYLTYHFTPDYVCLGDAISITANADGDIYGYQWQKDVAGEWLDINTVENPTATAKTFVINNTTPQHSGSYRCMLYGSYVCGTPYKYSEPIELKVFPLFEIVRQPQEQIIVCRGDEVSIDVVIDGMLVEDDPYVPTYQWYKDGKMIDPDVNTTANDPILYLDEIDFAQSGNYSVDIFKEDCRGREIISSEEAVVYVLATPEITQAPRSKTANLGDNLHFEVKAHVEGAPTDYPIHVQWFKGVKPGVPMEDGEFIEGAQASYLNIRDIKPADYSEYYYVEVTGLCGTAQSDYFAISEKPMIDILTQPTDMNTCPATDVTFTVEAEVSTIGPMMHYQWRFNGMELSDDAVVGGATTSELALTGADAAWAGIYDCVITLDTGDDTKTSNGAELTFIELPAIVSQPTTLLDLQTDDMLELTVVATGDDLMYQWYKDDVEIDGATDATFTIDAVVVEDAGVYTVKVYNECAEVMSARSEVTVTLLNGSSVEDLMKVGLTLVGSVPNPTNGYTRISFTSSKPNDVRLVITDIYGREVAELINGTVQVGEHSVEFNVNEYNLGSGIYFYSLISNGYSASKRLVIVK
jgi:hypothetical protein